MLTDVVPDHVAVAVPALDPAMPRWEHELGGRTAGWFSSGIFRSRQLRYPNGVKVELLAPHEADEPSDSSAGLAEDVARDNFVRRFLQRSGTTVHHVTLKIPDLHMAISEAEDAGFEVVDVDTTHDIWKEAFLRPSQVGGVIVQLAQNDETDAEWAERVGCDYEDPPTDAARVLGPIVTHPDLEMATSVWERLGGTVTQHTDALEVAWATAAFRVFVIPGEAAGGHGVAVDGDLILSQDSVLGAAVLPPPTT